MKTLLTIHDVMPETLDPVLGIISLLDSHNLPPAPLLVSPGHDWTTESLQTLRELSDKGHELAGHGWTHRARHIRSLGHRLHALLLSRRAAEHLALSDQELRDMLRKCFQWFLDNRLPPPSTYVPPAWGLGKLSRKTMRQLPFRWFETLTGIYDSHTNRFQPLPLIGFEADTPARKTSLSAFNAANLTLARLTRRPLRVAIHPHDLQLELADNLRNFLQHPPTTPPVSTP